MNILAYPCDAKKRSDFTPTAARVKSSLQAK